MEDNNPDQKSLFALDRATKVFLLVLLDAVLLFTVFVIGLSWYQAQRQFVAINKQVHQLEARFKALEAQYIQVHATSSSQDY